MKKYILSSILTIMSAVSLNAHSETSDRVSIYNIGNGTLIYSYRYTPNSNVSADYAYTLKGKWAENSNWDITHVGNGSMLFQNVYSKLCLQFYGDNYQVVENTCNINDKKQHFKPVLSSTGAIRLQLDGRPTCLYSHAGDSYFYIYSGVCKNNKEYLWALIPQLKDATN